MLHLGALQLILLGGLAAVGTTAGVAVLATSGPLARNNDAVHQATPSSMMSPTVASTPVGMNPDQIIQPTDAFSFAQLPTPDESNWKTVSGPTGALTVKVPPDWVVLPSALTDAAGKVVGDALTVYKPRGTPVDVGQATPGWVKVDLSTSPTDIPTSNGDEIPLRTVALTSVSGGRTVSMTALQFGQLTRFPNVAGEVVFLPLQRGANGTYLSGAAWTWLPATAADVALARAVMASAVVK